MVAVGPVEVFVVGFSVYVAKTGALWAVPAAVAYAMAFTTTVVALSDETEMMNGAVLVTAGVANGSQVSLLRYRRRI